MKIKSLGKPRTSSEIVKNAMRNYETYVKHYRSRNLVPMPLHDFLNNYKT